MHDEVIAQVIEECRAKADAYLRCAEALAKLLPEPVARPTLRPAPAKARRVLRSSADHQAAVLALIAHAKDGLGIAALTAQAGIKRHTVAAALRDLQAEGRIRKLGAFKTATYHVAPVPISKEPTDARYAAR